MNFLRCQIRSQKLYLGFLFVNYKIAHLSSFGRTQRPDGWAGGWGPGALTAPREAGVVCCSESKSWGRHGIWFELFLLQHFWQNGFQLLKGGSFTGLVSPALGQNGVQPGRAGGWDGQSLALFQLANDFWIFDTLKWFDAQHEDFPDADTEHPHVRGRCKPTKVDALRSHPLDGKFSLGGFIVTVLLD